MKNLLKDVVEGHMNIYKTALAEGRKIGYEEGYRVACFEFKTKIEELEKTIHSITPENKEV